jgi:hypothetical protein
MEKKCSKEASAIFLDSKDKNTVFWRSWEMLDLLDGLLDGLLDSFTQLSG